MKTKTKLGCALLFALVAVIAISFLSRFTVNTNADTAETTKNTYVEHDDVSATQVYYNFNWWSLIGAGVVTGGDRIRHELSEESRDIKTYKENYKLFFYMKNDSNATQTYRESVTYTVGASVEGSISASMDKISAELKERLSASISKTQEITINIPAGAEVEVYNFNYRKFVAYMEDKQTYQMRLLFWYVNTKTSYSYGTVKSYVAPGYEVKTITH